MSGSAAGKRLFPLWLPGLVALLFGAAFWVLHQRGAHRLQPAEVVLQPGGLALLRAELAARQGPAPRLRLALARSHLAAGEPDQGLAVLAPLLQQPHPSLAARWLALALLRQRLYQARPDSPARQADRHRIRVLAGELAAADLGPERLECLARWSLELGWPDLAARIYDRLVRQARGEPLGWLDLLVCPARAAEAGPGGHRAETWAVAALKALLAADEPRRALAWARRYVDYFPHSLEVLRQAVAVAEAADDSRSARDWGRRLWALGPRDGAALQAQLRRERAADQPRATLDWVRRLLHRGRVAPDLLRAGVAAATAMGRLNDARTLVRAWLRRHPRDLQQWREAVRLALAAADPVAAYAAARRAHRLAPEDPGLRRQAARLAEWAGRPQAALDLWLPLARGDPGGEAWRRALDLAHGLYHYRTEAGLLERLARRRPLSAAEVRHLVRAWEAAGRPRRADAALARHLRRRPTDRAAWRLRARLLDRMGRLARERRLRLAMRRRFGSTAREALRLADLLVRMGRLVEARRLLRAAATPQTAAIIRLRARLAWQDGDEAASRRQLLRLARRDPERLEDADWTRLVDLLALAGDRPRALAMALAAWRAHPSDAHWLRAAGLAAELEDWSRLRVLLDAATGRAGLHRRPAFWHLAGLAAAQGGDLATALGDLRHALALAPGDDRLAAELLWLLVDRGDDATLARYLRRFRSRAERAGLLWEPMGAGWQRLARPRRAATWYARAARAHPDRPALLLAWADTLETLGHRRPARALQRRALALLAATLARDGGRAWRRGGTPRSRRYLAALAPFTGAETIAPGLRRVAAGAAGDADRAAWVLTRLLAWDQRPLARRVVVRAARRRLALPAWQRLAVALWAGDGDCIDRILRAPGRLAPSDRVTGLAALGWKDRALRVAGSGLAHSSDRVELRRLRAHAVSLAAEVPNGLALAWRAHNLGNLDLDDRTLATALSRGPWTLHLALRHSRLDSAGGGLRLGRRRSERDLDLSLRRRTRRGAWRAEAGIDLRADDDRPRFGLQGRYALLGPFSLEGAWHWGEAGSESGAARALSWRNRLDLSLAADPTPRIFADLGLRRSWHRARGGGALGRGWQVQAHAGYRLWVERPEWRVSLYGLSSRTRLAGRLPAAIADALPAAATPAAILPASYHELGITTAVQRFSERPWGDVVGRVHYLAEASLYHSGPHGSLGLGARLGVGTRVLGRDDLSLSLSWSDARGGVDSRAWKRIGLRYSLRFW